MTEQVALTPSYDPKATILVRKGYYYGTPSDAKYDLENADDISRAFWRVDALTETNNRFSRASEKVQEYLTENYDELGDHADEIARLLGIDLTNTIEVEFDVTIKATITIPVGKDASDLSVYDFDIEISSNESEYEIEEFDAEIDRIRDNS